MTYPPGDQILHDALIKCIRPKEEDIEESNEENGKRC